MAGLQSALAEKSVPAIPDLVAGVEAGGAATFLAFAHEADVTLTF
ncbi:MAG TPA: hypothetical protein VGK74_27650 [Symbiobacteriaceae bacterium]|jgi:predicted peroxiredoxin